MRNVMKRGRGAGRDVAGHALELEPHLDGEAGRLVAYEHCVLRVLEDSARDRDRRSNSEKISENETERTKKDTAIPRKEVRKRN